MNNTLFSGILSKVAITIGVFASVFILCLYLTSELYLKSAMVHIDEISTKEKTNRLKEIFHAELEAQNQLLKNWAVWDDLYVYVKKPQKSFYDSNLGAENMADLLSSFVMIFDKNGNLVTSALKASENNETLKKMLDLKALSAENLSAKSLEINASVIVGAVDGKYISLAMHGISKSDRSGEPTGVIVFARWLDDSFYYSISKLFGTDVISLDRDMLSPNVKLDSNNTVHWIDVNNEVKDVYVCQPNVSKDFILKYEFDRVVYSYGLDIVYKFAMASALFIFLASFILFFFIKKEVLSRLISMASDISVVGFGNQRSYLKNAQGKNDEIEQIALATNKMLERMYGYQDALAKKSEELEAQVKEKIDELRQKDAAIMRQSKYVTIGETIANISHQWRQPLNDLWLIIQSLASKYKSDKLSEPKFDEFMGESKRLVSYMSDTIDDFQTFSKPDKEKVVFCLNDMVDRAISIVNSSLISNNIKLEKSEDGRYMVFGTPSEFAQAVLNIINNARDAFSGKNIESKFISVDVSSLAGIVVVSIEDNAGGIDGDVLETIFEPYVTTKYSKGGTGIGLYITRQAIEQCDGGAIEACNVEHGAKFTIILKEVKN